MHFSPGERRLKREILCQIYLKMIRDFGRRLKRKLKKVKRCKTIDKIRFSFLIIQIKEKLSR